MTKHHLADLQNRLADTPPADLAAVALEGLVAAWPPTEIAPEFPPDLALSFDKATRLIGQTLPGWSIELEGMAGDAGSWTCTLRDTGLRDDDEVIGIGLAATAPLAVLVALLQVLISRSKGYS